MKDIYHVAVLYVAMLGVVATQSITLLQSNFSPRPSNSRPTPTTPPIVPGQLITKEDTINSETPNVSDKPRKVCPSKESTEKARIAHNCDCGLYYECEDGEQILQECPAGKHFDYAREVCDSIDEVKCERPIQSYDYLEITNHDSECAPAGKAFQHESNSSVYYVCLGNGKLLKNCAAEQHFYVNLQRCEYPRRATHLISDSMNFLLDADTCPSGSAKKIFLPHECLCTKYYECVKGRKALRYCEDGLYFDRVSKICVDPVDADCEFKYPKKCPAPGSKEKVFLPHECTCYQYYECVKGRKALRFCPDNLYFDRLLQICRDPKIADCVLKPPPTEPTTETTPTEETEETEGTEGTEDSTLPTKPTTDPTCKPPCKECPAKGTAKIAHETRCEKYYDCLNGKKTEKNCPIGQHFDWEREVCDYIAIVNCIRPLPFYPMYNDLDPATCIGTCPEEDPEDAVLLPNEDCKKYCLCSNGIPWVMPCPDPLYFDSVDRVCKYKKDAVCAVRPLNQLLASALDKTDDQDELVLLTNQEDTDVRDSSAFKQTIYDDLDPARCIGTCPEEDPDDAVLLPHEDCKKYCLCSNGIPWVMSCPDPLYFDSVEKVCKYKKDAVCGERTL